MYYTVIKHDEHLRTGKGGGGGKGECRNTSCRHVLSQWNTQLRLLYLIYYIEAMWQKTIKDGFSEFYTLIKHGVLTNQCVHRVLSIS